MPPSISAADLESFSSHLSSSTKILGLVGAGLSAASGLPTFRGAGGLWRSHDATSLATLKAFQENPGFVWQFYSYRRHMALRAKPNPAHFALAELAKRKSGFLTLSQNVDGLSQRAGHPSGQLILFHGSLFDVQCISSDCGYVEQDNFTDPIVPALDIPREGPRLEPSGSDKTGEEATQAVSGALQYANAAAYSSNEIDISDDRVEIPQVQNEDLPRCPECKGLLRPGVVWFYERIPEASTYAIEDFIQKSEKIDLMLVIGTSAIVNPAATYIDRARAKGARVAVVNMDRADTPGGINGLAKGDWFFEGDAGVIVPQILTPP